MTRRLCPREQEVVDAMLPHGRLPEASDLQPHVAGCESCRELHQVMVLLRPDRERADEAGLPSAGQIWWRAAVRARMEAARAAARPVGWAQGATAASLLGIVGAAAVVTWPVVSRVFDTVFATVFATVFDTAFRRLSAGLETDALQTLPMMAVIERSLPLAVGVVAVVVIAPLLVLYFALAGDE